MEGSLMALVAEVGDAAEYGNIEAFIAKAGGGALDLSHLADKRIDYVSSRGIPFSLQYDESTWFPKARVKGAALDFENWPICESPYVTSRNGVLAVNDGTSGFTVAWQADKPVYTTYKIPKAK